MSNTTCKHTVHMVRGLPAGIFGEAYVVVTGIEMAPNRYRTEQFILLQRPVEALHMEAFEINGGTFPAELGTVDVDFAMEEGLMHAESLVSQLLEQRANELGRPDLAMLRVDLVSRPSPFVGCKMRGCFVDQMTAVKNATKCRSFSNYLGLLDQIGVVGNSAI